jgi:aminoglycoside phosphotransferase family enzyme
MTAQHDVVAFLSTPAAYGAGCTRVDRIETAISLVFLAGDRAYKLKREIRLPFVDYSTLARRAACCAREVALNRRTAPDLYRGVTPVTCAPDGTLALDGAGTPVEWLVEMHRFDQEALLDAVARRGALDPPLAAAIGREAARLHLAAAPRHDHGGVAGVRWVIDDNRAALARMTDLFDAGACARLHRDWCAALDRLAPLLEARRDGGWVRECHGDLHLRNICLVAGRPLLFDAIEFNDELSCVDILYDLAFLVMDLLHRGLPAQANAALNAWMERVRHYDALPLLPLFLSSRAAIRAKVGDRREAPAYFARAQALMTPGAA